MRVWVIEDVGSAYTVKNLWDQRMVGLKMLRIPGLYSGITRMMIIYEGAILILESTEEACEISVI